MPLDPATLIRKAASHLAEVGLKKGSLSHNDRHCFDRDKSPVCGVGALKWAATGNPKWVVKRSDSGFWEFTTAWKFMNRAAAEEDPSIPLDTDAFMTYNDDDDTSTEDVLSVMERAAQLAEESA